MVLSFYLHFFLPQCYTDLYLSYYALLIVNMYAAKIFILTGMSAPPRDYSIPGTHTSKIFSTIGAAATLVFAYNTGMLPEIQVPFILLFLSYFFFFLAILS